MTRSYFSPVPIVGVEITNRCNLRCRHCFNHSGAAQVQELSLPELMGIFDQIQAMGGSSIRISGGEPTLHPDFDAVIVAARQRGLCVSINSHGVYRRGVCERLVELPIDLFMISLDGLQEANDRIRGRGVFQHAIRTIVRLREARRSVVVGVHLGRSNIGDISGLIALAFEHGCDIKFSPLRPLGRAREYLLQDMLHPLDFYHAVQEITRLREEYPGIRISTDYDILHPMDDFESQPLERASCPAGRSFLNIGCDGFIYPCAFLITPGREFAAGNIQNVSLLTAWQTSPVFEPFRVIEKDTLCRACPVYTRACVGGCVAMSYLVTGSLEAHDPTCFIDHVLPAELRQMERHDDPL